MTAYEVAARIASCLEEDAIPYAIGGALALGAWAIPRDTKDVDVSVYVTQDQLDRVCDSLERAGVMVKRADAARDLARIGLFYGMAGTTRVDVFISDHPHFHDSHRRRVKILGPDGDSLWFVSLEDLVVHKLFFGRSKDVPDLERLFAAHPDLDTTYVRSWLERMAPQGDRRLALLDDLVRRFSITT